MMQHLITLPVMLPLATGVLLIFMARAPVQAKRGVSLASCVVSLVVMLALLQQANSGAVEVYALGNWAPPFGIVLVLDRLAAMMLLLSAVLALPALLYAMRSDDSVGANYHPLFHFQLMGLQGAFLTGDAFNLFVFFEITLISSYGLLMQGAGPERTRASLHYVILNLAGSALFLVGVGSLYGVLGSLNMADMAQRIAAAPAENVALIRAGGLILLAVFGLKAAMFPLYFWLPNAYSSAAPSVASLFAIMTKLGIYSILRVHGTLFGEEAGLLAGAMRDWLWPIALVTIVLGAIGVLGARTLKRVVSYLVIVSVGTLLAVAATGDTRLQGAGLYYLVHSTLVTAALFLLVDLIAAQRGATKDTLSPAQPLVQAHFLGGVFFVGAICVAGLPPFSGFISKAAIFTQSAGASYAVLLWPALLLAGLVTLISLSRAGSTVFWRHTEQPSTGRGGDAVQIAAMLLPFAAVLLLTVCAEAVLNYCRATALQLADVSAYIDVVMGFSPVEEG